MNLRGISPPYWLDSNEKLCVENQAVPESHLKSLYQFVVSVDIYHIYLNELN